LQLWCLLKQLKPDTTCHHNCKIDAGIQPSALDL
jgi:hypothetical protein